MKWLWLGLALFALQLPALSLDREAFTFTKYLLDVKIEQDQQRIGVRGKITLRNDSTSPQKYLCLQISSSLGWRSIQIDEKPADFVSQTYKSDIDHTGVLSEAIVTLPREIPTHGVIELNIGYEGTISSDSTRLEHIGVAKELARHSDWDEIGKSFTTVRGIGYVTWYPVATESADLSEGTSVTEAVGRWKQREAQSEMTITVESSAEAEHASPPTCTGKTLPSQVATTQSSRTECSFSPLGLSAPGFAAGDYSLLDRPSIDVQYLPDHSLTKQKSAAEDFALADEKALPFVTEWFGAPRFKAEVVELQDPYDSPFENGVTLLTPLVQTDPARYDLTAVHQLTHAAFPSSRLWIYEGLAHFAQAASVEKNSGRQTALDFMQTHRAQLVAAEKLPVQKSSPERATDESLINTNTEEFYRSKAMYVWWMLRDMVGEEKLKAALASYHFEQDNRSSYMQRLVEAQAKRDLEWFFDDWVYRDRGLPDFRVESAYTRKLVTGGYLVTVTVENRGDAGAEVPVTLRMQVGAETKRLEVRGKSKASIRIEAASTPLEIVVNDGSVPESDMSNNTYTIVLPAN